MCAPNRLNDRQTLRIPSWIRGFHVYKDWWTPTCGEILPLQPEPENAEDKNAVAVLKESRVIGHIPYHLANTKDRTGIITHFISKPTNRGSVEVSGKAVNRGGGLGMEIPCVYNFDGPSKHVNLLQQLIDVGNNPAVRTEVDADVNAFAVSFPDRRQRARWKTRGQVPGVRGPGVWKTRGLVENAGTTFFRQHMNFLH